MKESISLPQSIFVRLLHLQGDPKKYYQNFLCTE